MTVALYARRKGWSLDKVTVRLRHSRIDASDCAECESKDGMLDRIERELDIANRCPVHRTLKSEISIQTRLA